MSHSASERRRQALGEFIRSRRERTTPEMVGMPPTLRRRTPGLRREEVALLSGIGVTWYTWLEQGRPINVSTQVLSSISRVLRLDAAERAHLFTLAELADPQQTAQPPEVGPAVQAVLDALEPVPATVVGPSMVKELHHGELGTINIEVVHAWLTDQRGTRLSIYTPGDDAARATFERLRRVTPRTMYIPGVPPESELAAA